MIGMRREGILEEKRRGGIEDQRGRGRRV